MPAAMLWGWDKTNERWLKVQVDTEGRLIPDPPELPESMPADNEVGKTPVASQGSKE
ncbi:hypothetical protein ES708_30942 [subsurface metagenome]